jgi:hypothetical protein
MAPMPFIFWLVVIAGASTAASIVSASMSRGVTVVIVSNIGVACCHHVCGIGFGVAILSAALTDSTGSKLGLSFASSPSYG